MNSCIYEGHSDAVMMSYHNQRLEREMNEKRGKIFLF